MKARILLIGVMIQLSVTQIVTAQNEQPAYTARAYVDNDFLNDRGRSTDKGYSNGARLDLSYTKTHKSKLFLDKWMPRAGDSSVDVYNVGFNHIIYTQADIAKDYYQQHDYNWAGAMYLTHTLSSYNPKQQYDFQTELVAGVMGPASLDKPFQRTFHYVIHDNPPMGWNNQFNNDVLLNVNFTAENEIALIKDYFMLMGSAQIQAGTMSDAIDMGPEIRVGKMAPYFNGYVAQHSGQDKKGNHAQAYFWLKPGVQLVAWSSMLEGGMFSPLPVVRMYDEGKGPEANMYERIARPEINNFVTYVSYGVVVVYGRVSASYTQTHTSQLVKDSYEHTYGNISITYSW